MKPLALRNILVATDLDPEAVASIDSAIRLAELSGAQLHVLHARETPAHDDETAAQIAEVQSRFEQHFEVNLLTGPPAALITQEAARTQADVIVLGRHRRRSGHMGSTADRVVRIARTPCLVLPDMLTLPLTTVLVPIDVQQSAGALAVGLTWASALRQRADAHSGSVTRLVALYVQPDESAPDDVRAQLQRKTASVQHRFAQIAGVAIEQQIERHHDIPDAILTQARNQSAQLTVIGTRGKRIDTDPLGSVSSAVVKRSDRPVLLVPPEAWENEAV
jgi:nucleotide-binding universal stress UspA family protein